MNKRQKRERVYFGIFGITLSISSVFPASQIARIARSPAAGATNTASIAAILLKYGKSGVKYERIVKFPAVTRDLAVVLDDEVLVGNMLVDIKKSSKILGEEFTVTQEELLTYILKNNSELYKLAKKLEEKLEELNNLDNITLSVNFTKDELLTLMRELRTHGDNLEGVVEHKMWPFPTYEDLLFKL